MSMPAASAPCSTPVTLHVYESGNHGWGAESSADFPDGDNFRTDLSMWLKKIK